MMEALLGGGVAAFISTIGVIYAAKAEKNSRPVSNGFTSYVLQKLDRIEDKIDNHDHP